MEIKLDEWQKEVLRTKGHITLRSGRQVGKSTVVSIKAADLAVKHPNKKVIIIASVERQAQLLFEKVMEYIIQHYKKMIKGGKDKPTKHRLTLTNGSIIYSLPSGLSGYGIRGYTIDLLIADEAAFIPEAVWSAVTPMLAVTGGEIWLLSTPFKKEGYYYKSFNDPSFTKFHISSEDCPRINKDFLKQEKERLTAKNYAQEYLGEFVDDLSQFFPIKLIRECLVIERGCPSFSSLNKQYAGVDVARMGGDEVVIFGVEKNRNSGNLRETFKEVYKYAYLTETSEKIKAYDAKYKFKKIYIDDGGLGVGVFDYLLNDNQTKRKVIAINNSRRSLDSKDKRRKKLMKEDLYTNLLNLMEKGKIQLVKSDETLRSLSTMQVEYTDNGMKIYGPYSHIAEALVRAAWCVKDKSLNIWITS